MFVIFLRVCDVILLNCTNFFVPNLDRQFFLAKLWRELREKLFLSCVVETLILHGGGYRSVNYITQSEL